MVSCKLATVAVQPWPFHGRCDAIAPSASAVASHRMLEPGQLHEPSPMIKSALPSRTCLLAPPFSSILLPSTMKGKLSGSAGFACDIGCGDKRLDARDTKSSDPGRGTGAPKRQMP